MALPLKRICRQATRQVREYQTQYTSRAAQSTSSTPCPYIQQRSYAHPARQQPRLNGHEVSDSDYGPSKRDDFLPATTEDAEAETLLKQEELSSTGYAELEQHRELREMVRLAAWEMPLLSTMHKPFQAPDRSTLPLRWRYTTYFGEAHPASRKVMVMFRPDDLSTLSTKQKLKLCKLAGTRYRLYDKSTDQKDVIRMSCESFETQAQNKRFLGDTIEKLIAEARDDGADSFEDVPLDTRHTRPKKVLRFPEEWKMTPQKREELEARRRTLLLEEGKRVEEDRVVSGAAAIEAARQVRLQQMEQPVMAEARQNLPKGKMGRKEMGQTRGANR